MKLIMILSILFFSIGYSVENQEVIHLKNGDIVKGTIIENYPNEYVKIKLQGGSIFTYQYSEIEKFTKDVDKKQGYSMDNAQKMMMYESQKKSEGTAMIFSCLLSSAGHAYADNWPRGLAFTAGTVGFYVMALSLGLDYNCSDDDYYSSCGYEVNAMYPIGMLGVIATRIYEVVDAGKEVKKYNQKLYDKVYGIQPGFSMNIIPQKKGAFLKIAYNF